MAPVIDADRLSSEFSSLFPHSFDRSLVVRLLQLAFDEDLNSLGDVTSDATAATTSLQSDIHVEAYFLAKEDGILSGVEIIDTVMKHVGASIQWSKRDGDKILKGTRFGTCTAPRNTLLVMERTMLNIMQRMSGIATNTRRMVDAIGHQRTRLLDTRKTAPGMRTLDKMAVRHGGGVNHRNGLYDMILIKDNHITAAGGVKKALENCQRYKQSNNSTLPIEIEARTLEEVKEILEIGQVQRIMLDNMIKVTYADGNMHNLDPKNVVVDTSMLQQALKIINGRFPVEVSGNVNMATISAIGATNVDFVSVGALTHSVMALDISMKIVESMQ